jgi:hypothetical protein
VPVIPTGPPSTFDVCLSSNSIGIAPSSWVPGILNGLKCVLNWIFIPSYQDANGVNHVGVDTSSFTADLSKRIPISYITDAYNATNTIITAVNNSVTSGQCSPPTLDPFGRANGYLAQLVGKINFTIPVPGDICGGSTTLTANYTTGEVYGYRTWLRLTEALGIWLATVATIWRMLPWARRNDGIQILDQFGGLSDHIMENGVEVFQTNEGSD